MKRSTAQEALGWAVNMFGPVAKNRDERALRLVEEAIELAQAEGVGKDVMLKVVERVYSRPPGNTFAEIGAVALTLDLLCVNIGLIPGECAITEFRRVKSKSREHFAARHAKKAALGIANLSPVE